MRMTYSPKNTLRARRERLSYTQTDFARLVGVSDRTVRLWEAGERVPQMGNRRPLAQALGIDLDELAALLAEIQGDYVEFVAGRATPSGDEGGLPPSGGAPR